MLYQSHSSWLDPPSNTLKYLINFLIMQFYLARCYLATKSTKICKYSVDISCENTSLQIKKKCKICYSKVTLIQNIICKCSTNKYEQHLRTPVPGLTWITTTMYDSLTSHSPFTKFSQEHSRYRSWYAKQFRMQSCRMWHHIIGVSISTEPAAFTAYGSRYYDVFHVVTSCSLVENQTAWCHKVEDILICTTTGI